MENKSKSIIQLSTCRPHQFVVDVVTVWLHHADSIAIGMSEDKRGHPDAGWISMITLE